MGVILASARTLLLAKQVHLLGIVVIAVIFNDAHNSRSTVLFLDASLEIAYSILLFCKFIFADKHDVMNTFFYG